MTVNAFRNKFMQISLAEILKMSDLEKLYWMGAKDTLLAGTKFDIKDFLAEYDTAFYNKYRVLF